MAADRESGKTAARLNWRAAFRALFRALPIKVWVVLGLALVLLASCLLFVPPPPTGGPPPSPVAKVVTPDRCNQDRAALFYQVSRTSPPIRGDQFIGGLTIYVDGRAWSRMRVDAQKRIIANADCAIAGTGKHLVSIEVKGNSEGPALDVYGAGELSGIRAAGYGDF